VTASVDVFRDPGPFRVSELAAALRCSPDWIHKLIRSEKLHPGRVGTHYRIPADQARALAREVIGAATADSADR
jgi:excisionase family DNA binding protein